MKILNRADYAGVSRAAAEFVAAQIRQKPDSVMCFPTGGTPEGMYAELVKMHRNDGLDFSQVTTFNLDEYVSLGIDDPQSYVTFMRENLFCHVNLNPQSTHLPNGLADDPAGECENYERLIREAKGIDLCILGIGENGHLGFNEPISGLTSRTRCVILTAETRKINSRYFPSLDAVPKAALTMGLGTILEARQLLLLASGPKKAAAIRNAVEGPVASLCPASIIQWHADATVVVDEEAAGLLQLKSYYKEVEEAELEFA